MTSRGAPRTPFGKHRRNGLARTCPHEVTSASSGFTRLATKYPATTIGLRRGDAVGKVSGKKLDEGCDAFRNAFNDPVEPAPRRSKPEKPAAPSRPFPLAVSLNREVNPKDVDVARGFLLEICLGLGHEGFCIHEPIEGPPKDPRSSGTTSAGTAAAFHRPPISHDRPATTEPQRPPTSGGRASIHGVVLGSPPTRRLCFRGLQKTVPGRWISPRGRSNGCAGSGECATAERPPIQQMSQESSGCRASESQRKFA